MIPRRAVLAAAAVTLLAACPGDDGPDHPNPPRLWLALDGSEVEVRLVPVEPPPF
ncbi:MAG: hypothetical protein HS111_05975 [Kofleriaceae bacterium]|nr:hypothetical protein [Kofleriaceae bacterium]MCL4225690.1 hypothetical protein [Myxococcales bacterium]